MTQRTRIATDGIQDDAVTYAKLQNVSATDRLLGRSSSGAGDVEEITCTSFGRSLIDDADAAAARTTLGVQPTASPAFTGAATFENTGNVVPVTITNTGTANSFVVNDASGDTTPFVVDASGRVGIGVTPASSGSAALQVRGDVDIFGNSSDRSITYNVGVGDDGIVGWYRSKIAFVASGAANNVSQNIVFYTKDGDNSGSTLAERFRIGHTGTATFAGQVLVTAGSVSAPAIAASSDTDSGVYFPAANECAIAAGGLARVIFGTGDNRTLVRGNNEQYALGVHYGGAGGSVYFGATSNSATPDAAISNSGGTTLMLLKNGGEVLVGGTTDQGAYNLQCNGTGVWGAGAYVNGSDKRIKDDIAPLPSCTDVIESLRPVTFRYKGSWSKDQSVQPGFIAQDLQQALTGQPYMDGVVQQGTEYLSVAYQTLIPLLVKALQESNARIAALEERLNHG